jgi:hypothetical protein
MEFAPSHSNRLRIYLFAQGQDLSTSDAYFIEVGENGNQDALNFFVRSENEDEILASGPAGHFSSNSSSARIRIVKTYDGTWNFYYDTQGGENWIQAFEMEDSTLEFDNPGYFGIECIYSGSRAQSFFFDDFIVSDPIKDTISPLVKEVQLLSDTIVQIIFTENVDSASSRDLANYKPTGGILAPDSVLPFNPSAVQLLYHTPLIHGIEYLLKISDIMDLSGNIMADTVVSLTYYSFGTEAGYDVIINEIMPDPSPAVALPNAEYIEIFNRSGKTLNLKNWIFYSGSKSVELEDYIFLPGHHLILCDTSAVSEFEPFGEILGIRNFPGLANKGSVLKLIGPAGALVHLVEYSDIWYRDASKNDGGWSLEMINPAAPCFNDMNWAASTAIIGGTPGEVNSNLVLLPDSAGPNLIRIYPVNDMEIQVYFDKALSGSTGLNTDLFNLDPAIPIDDIVFSTEKPNIVSLLLQEKLEYKIQYQIEIQGIEDCIQIASTSTQLLDFGMPEEIGPADVLINEILFNPNPGGKRFLEILNNSNQYFKLSDLIIADINGSQINAHPIETDYLFYPGMHVVISPDPFDIVQRYSVFQPDQLIRSTLPSFSEKDGNVTLYTPNGIIDEFDFHSYMHHPLLSDQEGVSLERLSPLLDSDSPDNWHSAAASAGYATPTQQNSQSISTLDSDASVEIVHSTFSPDGDGFHDFLLIRFSPEAPGYLATIKIFDSAGHYIRDLAVNELIGKNSAFQWDGTDDSSQTCRYGIYIIWIELFNSTGQVKHFKEVCVLAGRL